jgi:nucleoside-diphosphate-sugar epimerase
VTRVLILGGTRFVGRHLAAAALDRGWQVTLFNRGHSDPDAFPEAEHRVGDRDGGLQALAEGEWDAVIDTSGYVPRLVRASAELLAPRVGLYLFISSVSAYAAAPRAGMTEDAPLAELSDERTEDVTAHYGGLKGLCEEAVGQTMGGRAVVVRPGIIVGPHDPTNRFAWWVTRVASGGRVVAPEPRDQPVQVIDARDLAEFCMHLVDNGRSGVFNAVGDPMPLETMLQTIAETTGSRAELEWVPEAQLLEDGGDLPLWVAPGSNPNQRGLFAMSNERAKQAGLALRPLADTIRDTLAWERAG